MITTLVTRACIQCRVVDIRQSFNVMSVDRRVPSVIRLVGSTLVQRNNKMTATEGVRRVEQLSK